MNKEKKVSKGELEKFFQTMKVIFPDEEVSVIRKTFNDAYLRTRCEMYRGKGFKILTPKAITDTLKYFHRAGLLKFLGTDFATGREEYSFNIHLGILYVAWHENKPYDMEEYLNSFNRGEF